jgi:hypothetical protein
MPGAFSQYTVSSSPSPQQPFMHGYGMMSGMPMPFPQFLAPFDTPLLQTTNPVPPQQWASMPTNNFVETKTANSDIRKRSIKRTSNVYEKGKIFMFLLIYLTIFYNALKLDRTYKKIQGLPASTWQHQHTLIGTSEIDHKS